MTQRYPFEISDTAQPQPQPQPYTSKSATHYRPADLRSEILVPLLMATVTGILALLVTVWLWLEWKWLPNWSPIAAFAVTFGGVWVWRLLKHDTMLTSIEEITRLDLDRDGFIGRPAAPEVPAMPQEYLHIDLSQSTGKGQQLKRFDFPCDLDTLALVAEAMLAGSTLPTSDWTPLKSGRPFSESSLQKFKAVLIAQRLARLISTENPRLGLVLTDEGKAFMLAVKRQAQAPAPED